MKQIPHSSKYYAERGNAAMVKVNYAMDKKEMFIDLIKSEDNKLKDNRIFVGARPSTVANRLQLVAMMHLLLDPNSKPIESRIWSIDLLSENIKYTIK